MSAEQTRGYIEAVGLRQLAEQSDARVREIEGRLGGVDLQIEAVKAQIAELGQGENVDLQKYGPLVERQESLTAEKERLWAQLQAAERERAERIREADAMERIAQTPPRQAA